MTPIKTESDLSFAALARSRRSWLGYTGEAISEIELEELIDIAGSAPSEANLQPWRFVAALGRKKVDRVLPAFLSPNQPKLRDAGNVLLVYGDPTSVDTNPLATAFYDLGFMTRRDFAIRNASLASMVFMLAAHARGLPTRPMAGYDPDALAAIIGAPAHWIPVMAILIGRPSVQSVEPPSRVNPGALVRFV